MTHDDTEDPRRAAIEAEIRDRLARERAPASAPAASSPAGQTPLAAVSLMCLSCHSLSSGDAHFCTQCGAKFNALVVAKPGSGGLG